MENAHWAAALCKSQPLASAAWACRNFTGPAMRPNQLQSFIARLIWAPLSWDTADVYGSGRNEELVGRAIQGRRNEVVLVVCRSETFTMSQTSL
jgi:predicted oxidoreductase